MNISTGLRWNENWRSDATEHQRRVQLQPARHRAEPRGGDRARHGDALLDRRSRAADRRHPRRDRHDRARVRAGGPVHADRHPRRALEQRQQRPHDHVRRAAGDRGRVREVRLPVPEPRPVGRKAGRARGVDRLHDAGRKAVRGLVPVPVAPEPARAPRRAGSRTAMRSSVRPTEFANLPPSAFFAEGVNGQFIFVCRRPTWSSCGSPRTARAASTGMRTPKGLMGQACWTR